MQVTEPSGKRDWWDPGWYARSGGFPDKPGVCLQRELAHIWLSSRVSPIWHQHQGAVWEGPVSCQCGLYITCAILPFSVGPLVWGTGWRSVQSFSRVRLFATPWTAACQASLSITNSWNLLKPMSIELVTPSNHLILCCPLLLTLIFPSIRVFSNELAFLIRCPKYWSFSFSISPSNEYSGRIFFRIDWLDLLAVQGTLKSLLQHNSSKASILQCSAFFIVQLSHPYMTTGKTIILMIQTFVGKVISLLFNMLSRFVIP